VTKFDNAAKDYDKQFTKTAIGKLQRQQVWRYLTTELNLDVLHPLNILELNCGTGEDATMMAAYGHTVTATDASLGMLEMAAQKQKKSQIYYETRQLKFEEIENLTEKYDLIFSNFGGLNCMPEESFAHFFSEAAKRLNPEGRLVLVLMSDNCFMEKLYFFAKGKRSEMQRRKNKDGLDVIVSGSSVKTWYYHPDQISNWALPHFKEEGRRSVGLSVPPSYLEPFFSKRKNILSLLSGLDNSLYNFENLAAHADHFLIDLKLTD